MTTVEDPIDGGLRTLFEKAQKGVLEPRLLDVVDPNDPGVKCQVLLTPTVDLDGAQSVVVVSVKAYLDQYRTAPEYISGTSRLTDLNSFISHVNRFKDSGSVLFIDSIEPSLKAVFDYHEGPESPRFGHHMAKYVFPLSEEWKAWKNFNSSLMTQTAFACFVEDHLQDVVAPSEAGETAAVFAQLLGLTYATAAKLLELSRGLTLRVDQTVGEIRNLATGEAQVTFNEMHTDEKGQPLKIPGGFVIGIPVFRNGDLYKIPVRLRYRKSESKLVWFYELYRSDAVFDFAIRDACDAARAATSLPLFMGSPEQ
jgi:uncharacterized protein YfdQ (DUF2303 family)